MPQAIQDAANFRNPAGDAGRRFAVNHHHGFQAVIFVTRQPSLCLGGHRAMPPVPGNVFHAHAEILRHLTPELRKVAGLKHQHAVAR